MTEYKIVGYNIDRPYVIDEITFSVSGAMLMSRGISDERPTGVQGMLRYNTEEHYFEYFNGQSNTWLPISLPRPYYIRFFKNANTDFPEGSFQRVNSLTLDSTATTIDASSNFSSNAWTPPAGTYLVNAQAAISRTGDEIYEVRFAIDKNGTGSTLRVVTHRITDSIADVTYQSLNISDIIVADGTDIFTLSTYVNISGTGLNYTQRGDPVGEQTFFSAYKIA